jgi:hypothetical protein
MRNKQEIARVLPIIPRKKRPSHAQLRLAQQKSALCSADLIRQDREAADCNKISRLPM